MNTVPLDDFSALHAPPMASTAIHAPAGMQQVPGTPYWVVSQHTPAPVYFQTNNHFVPTPTPGAIEIDEITVSGPQDSDADQKFKSARTSMIVLTSFLAVFAGTAAILDGIFSWPRAVSGYLAFVVIVTSIFHCGFFFFNWFHMIYAVLDREKYRSKVHSSGVVLAFGSLLCAILHMTALYPAGGVIAGLEVLLCAFELVFLKCVTQRELHRPRLADPLTLGTTKV